MARYFTRLRLVKYLAISHADSCNKSYILYIIYIYIFGGGGGRDVSMENGRMPLTPWLVTMCNLHHAFDTLNELSVVSPQNN